MKAKYTTLKEHPLKKGQYCVHNIIFANIPPYIGTLEQCKSAQLFAEKNAAKLVNQNRNEVVALLGEDFVSKVESLPVSEASFIRRPHYKEYIKTVNVSDGGDIIGELNISYIKRGEEYIPFRYVFNQAD